MDTMVKLVATAKLLTLSNYAMSVVERFVNGCGGMVYRSIDGVTIYVALKSDEQLIRCITAMHNAEG